MWTKINVNKKSIRGKFIPKGEDKKYGLGKDDSRDGRGKLYIARNIGEDFR